jgi:hypothetical protein
MYFYQYFWHKYVHIIWSLCCHGCFASVFTATSAGLCTFATRSLRQICRAAAHAEADHRIQSDQVCATNQRAASGNLDRHASPARSSAMAILVTMK